MAALVEKQSDWPILNVIDQGLVQSPPKDFVVPFCGINPWMCDARLPKSLYSVQFIVLHYQTGNDRTERGCA